MDPAHKPVSHGVTEPDRECLERRGLLLATAVAELKQAAEAREQTYSMQH